jgi:hypothetical protein
VESAQTDGTARHADITAASMRGIRAFRGGRPKVSAKADCVPL